MARIGLLTTSYPRHGRDFAGRFVAELARWLACTGDAVEVLAPHPAQETHPGVTCRPLRYALTPRLLYGAGAPDNLHRDLRAWLQAPAFVGHLALACWRHSQLWDGVISHWLLPCGVVAGRCSREIPHLAVAHSSDVHLLCSLGQPVGRTLLELGLSRKRTALALTSEALRSRLLELSPRGPARRRVERAEVLRMGIDARRLDHLPGDSAALRREHDLQGTTVALFVGRLVPVKGVATLIEACAALQDMVLVVVGDGPEGLRLRKLARKLGARVRFLGALGQAEVESWLHAADCLVLPSVVLPDGRSDSAPVVLLEAMAAGLPVVASQVGGNPELVRPGENGLLLPPGEAEPLRAMLSALGRDHDLRRHLGRGARATALQHTWDRVGGRIRRLLRAASAGDQ
jgi:glycosyltransferase involved in cell wall biosynthesis